MASASSPTLSDKDDPFKRRLDEINREMLDILNSRHPSVGNVGGAVSNKGDTNNNNHMYSPLGNSSGKMNTSGHHPYHQAAVLEEFSDVANKPLAVTSSDLLRREVQLAVSREMKSFEDRTRELVAREWDSRVKELDAVLRSRFQELRTANDNMGRSILDITEGVNQQFQNMNTQYARLESDMKKKFGDMEREMKAQLREVNNMRDIVQDVESQVRADGREVDRRVEDVTKRHSELVRHTLASMDEKIGNAERELQAIQRDARKQMEGEVDSIIRSVGRLQGASEATSTALERVLSDVNDITESMAAAQSGLRTCRGDINRLEIALRSKEARNSNTNIGGTQNHVDPMSSGGAPSSPDLVYRIQQDVFALKECVAYLHGLITSNQGGNKGPMKGGSAFPFQFPFGSQQPAASSAPPLAMDQFVNSTRPPYVTSTRSTPTKARVAAQAGGIVYEQDQAAGLQAPPLQRDDSAHWSDRGGNDSAGPSPTYRTVPDSDSEEERENSKLARSELD